MRCAGRFLDLCGPVSSSAGGNSTRQSERRTTTALNFAQPGDTLVDKVTKMSSVALSTFTITCIYPRTANEDGLAVCGYKSSRMPDVVVLGPLRQRSSSQI